MPPPPKDATPKSYLIKESDIEDIEALRYMFNSELYSDHVNHCYGCSDYANCTFSVIVC